MTSADTWQDAAAVLDKVRRAHPCTFVTIQAHPDLPMTLVQVRLRNGPWVTMTVPEAIQFKRMQRAIQRYHRWRKAHAGQTYPGSMVRRGDAEC